MKQPINPLILGGSALALIVVLAFLAIRLLGGPAQTTTPTAEQDKNRPAEINGQKVPPGVPYDYATRSK